ncbi:hypothetical protein BDQ94DRAFT_164462 [Aspergillus welwitschiae]|uniref:Uncharacterized protein n=1 Tax=Aspergillus welwitschiae TaxID=1341132 RepID=A0A3F3PHQ4_9EURO|nr:hypothetical protein BDQ94DRAFT_164462 [Aspergillus welwitschiae]RDH26481.1 hypothetical protein BDQ94DRAFT_164462 [Aspergillus welwitschiae]
MHILRPVACENLSSFGRGNIGNVLRQHSFHSQRRKQFTAAWTEHRNLPMTQAVALPRTEYVGVPDRGGGLSFSIEIGSTWPADGRSFHRPTIFVWKECPLRAALGSNGGLALP